MYHLSERGLQARIYQALFLKPPMLSFRLSTKGGSAMKAFAVFMFLFFTVAVSAQDAAGVHDKAYLRSTPSTKGKVLATLVSGDEVRIIKHSGKWVNVQAKRRTGWVR